MQLRPAVAFAFAVLLLSVSTTRASPSSPFVPPQGLGTLELATQAFVSRLAFDDDGVAVVDRSLRASTLTAALELGVGEGLSLTAAVPLRTVFVADERSGGAASSADVDGRRGRRGERHRRGGDDTVVSGLGDARVGLRLVLWHDDVVELGLAGDVKVPLYEGVPSARERVPSSSTLPLVPSSTPALGDGQTDMTALAEFRSTLPLGGAFSWRTGYRLRTGGVSDAVVGGGALSVDVLEDRLAPAAWLDWVWSLDPALARDGSPLEAVGRGIAVVGLSCRARLPEIDAGLALDVDVGLRGRGRNAMGGVQVGAGLSYAF